MMRSQAKVFTFILFVAVLQVMGNVRRECRKATGVSWDSLKKLKKGELERMDPKLKCYLKCFLVKNEIMSESTVVEIESALRHLPRKLQDGSRTILDRCKSMRGENSCVTGFQIAKCYFRAYPEVLKKVALV